MDTSDPSAAATAASIAATIIGENSTLNDSAFTLSLQKEPPDVHFERLCKIHQGSGIQQECQICQRFFPNWYKLKQHLHTHADFRPYTCSYCEKTFRNYSKKSRHEKTHSGLKPFVCKICNKHVSRSEHLKRHLLTHTESHPFKCVLCEYRSRRLDCIRYHMKNKHPDSDTRQIMFNQQLVNADCDLPNDASDILWQQYKESTPEGLALINIRIQDHHSPKPKKKKKKKSPAATGIPTSTNGQDGGQTGYPINCNSNVQLTVSQFPSTLPPSMIPGFSGFTTMGQVKNESPTSSGVATSNSQTSPKVADGEKHLNSSFTGSDDGSGRSKYYLTQITQPVLNMTPTNNNGLVLPKNMCGICEKSFDCPSKLQRHLNTHNGVRPYKCDICGKALSRPEHLKRHLLTHDPDKQNKQHYKAPKVKNKNVTTAATMATGTSSITTSTTSSVAGSLTGSMTAPHPGGMAPGQPTQLVAVVKQEVSDDQQTVNNCHVQMEPKPAGQQVSAPPVVMAASWAPVTLSAQPVPRSVEQQLTPITTYSPHVAMLHNFAAFGSQTGQPMYQNRVVVSGDQQQITTQNVLMANAGQPPCGMPVFPTITEMR